MDRSSGRRLLARRFPARSLHNELIEGSSLMAHAPQPEICTQHHSRKAAIRPTRFNSPRERRFRPTALIRLGGRCALRPGTQGMSFEWGTRFKAGLNLAARRLKWGKSREIRARCASLGRRRRGPIHCAAVKGCGVAFGTACEPGLLANQGSQGSLYSDAFIFVGEVIA